MKSVFLKYTSRPNHNTHKIFVKNYAAIHEMKPVLTLNKWVCLILVTIWKIESFLQDW